MLFRSSIARKSKKEQYGNTIAVYTDKMEDQRNKSNTIVSKMQAAIDNKEFIPYLQPKMGLETGKIIGAEVLVRWKTKDTIIPPNDFIPVFERNGFITTLDLYMLEEACIILSDYKLLEKYQIHGLAVNISRFSLLQNDIMDKILNITNKYNINRNSIELEVTESAFASEKKVLIKTITQLRKIGFQIAIDDFGNEYSSLATLYEIPIDVVKLDKSLVDTLYMEKGRSLVHSTINLLKNLDNVIVAEGIEDENQANLLRIYKCDIGQGYYFEIGRAHV